jgi:hypothetical protein
MLIARILATLCVLLLYGLGVSQQETTLFVYASPWTLLRHFGSQCAKEFCKQYVFKMQFEFVRKYVVANFKI